MSLFLDALTLIVTLMFMLFISLIYQGNMLVTLILLPILFIWLFDAMCVISRME